MRILSLRHSADLSCHFVSSGPRVHRADCSASGAAIRSMLKLSGLVVAVGALLLPAEAARATTMQATKNPTTTTVSGSPNPASFTPPAAGAVVNLTATVFSGGGTVNEGTVTFSDGSTTLGSPAVLNGTATLSTTLTEGTHPIVATYSGGSDFSGSLSSYNQRVDAATTKPSAGSGVGPYTYCNPGAITVPGLGASVGAAGPYPSNIFVTNLPGTVNGLTVTLNGFSTNDQGDLLSLLVGPGGNNLDFFSLTGSSLSVPSGPANIAFTDTASSRVTENLLSSGSFLPTSLNTNIAYPQCPQNISNCFSPPVGPPLPSNPFTPTNKAATAGTAILGNANASGVFGGTSASTYNGNGTWSLYLDDGGPTGAGKKSSISGWCVNFTENLPSVTADLSHTGPSGPGSNFAQGGPGSITVDITNNGTGATGDPTGGNNPLSVTDTLNSAFAYAGFTGTGWSCSASGQTVTCTNDSTVGQGSDYNPLAINVNVSAVSPPTVTNLVSVSGGGANLTTSNTDSITILPAAVLALAKSHVGTFTAGQTAQWNITVSNTAANGMTYGTITVSDSLPAGYTLSSFTSTGAWSCGGAGAVTCTTTEGIAAGIGSVISLTVNVPANSPSSVTNVAAAWGGGDLVHTNASSAAISNADTVSVASQTPPPTVISYSVLFGAQSFNLIGSSRIHLPWEITGVQVVFSQPIATANVNSLSGVTTTGLAGVGTNTLTWTTIPIPIGSFATVLAGSGANAIKDATGNALNGGTSFSEGFKVLWGDFNDDGVVTASDAVLVNSARLMPYNIFADMNGDGVVNVTDVNVVRTRIGTSQP